MRNIPINEVDHLPQPVLALGSDYPADTLLDTHSHRRAQFLYAPEGLMKVETEDGQWLVLPYSGVWIPAGKPHRVWLSKVRTYSLYIEVSNAPRQATYCEVIQVSPLLHQLLIQANQLPVDYQRADRDGALIDLLLYELEAAPALPLFIPLPHNTLLSKQCADFMEHPIFIVALKIGHMTTIKVSGLFIVGLSLKLACPFKLGVIESASFML